MPNVAAGRPNLHVNRHVVANSVGDDQLTAGSCLPMNSGACACRDQTDELNDEGQLRTGHGMRPPLSVRADGARADHWGSRFDRGCPAGHQPRSCSAIKAALRHELTPRSRMTGVGHRRRRAAVRDRHPWHAKAGLAAPDARDPCSPAAGTPGLGCGLSIVSRDASANNRESSGGEGLRVASWAPSRRREQPRQPSWRSMRWCNVGRCSRSSQAVKTGRLGVPAPDRWSRFAAGAARRLPLRTGGHRRARPGT